jgi:sugar fermentation stimulation protein A
MGLKHGLKKVQKTIRENSGVYLLEIFASHPFTLKNKIFSHLIFEPGYYYYSGSAQKNLSQRINRHLKKEKTIYWHIDYLTTIPTNEIKSIFILKDVAKNFECNFIFILLNEFNLKIAVNNFGNGDCHSCKSHLLYSKKKIDHNHFISRYQSMVRLIPSSSETF